jgi:pimeloyl-ACP methyl ester carboxylesterase
MMSRKLLAAPTLLHQTLNRVCKESFLRRVGLLIVVCLLLAGCGPSTTSSTIGGNGSVRPARSFAGLLDIGSGRKMYLECRGSGSPTVVLVSGLDSAADVWISYQAHPSQAVFNAVAGFTRVCAYDRPGTPVGDDLTPSRSTPVPQPTTAQDAVRDLHALLRAAGEPGPYLLVGHSYGGLITRLYAGEYPNEVVGIVFVDAGAPEWQTAMTPQQWHIVQALNGPSKDQLTKYPAMERIDFDASVAQVRAAAPLRRSLPVVVLSRDTRAHPMGPFIASLVAQGTLPSFVPADFGYSNDRAWSKVQDALARLVPNTEHIVVTGSDHTIQIDHPQAVTDALHKVFDTSLTDLAYSSSVCTRCPRSWCRPGTRRCDPFTMKGANGNGTRSV